VLEEMLAEDGHYEALRIIQRARSGLGAELIFEQRPKDPLNNNSTYIASPSRMAHEIDRIDEVS